MLPTTLLTNQSTMRTTTAVCVLAALLVPAVMAMDASPMFAELLHASKAGPSSRVRIASAHEKMHTQHICLQETKQHSCRFVGCPNLERCNDTSNPTSGPDPVCFNCRNNNVYMSEVTCCGDQYAKGYGDGNSFGAGVNAPTLKVGSCTWDVTLEQDPPGALPRLSTPASTAVRLGTAFATCYLTSGIEYCGEGSLCDNMVLTFKGGWYLAAVRSTLPEGLAGDLSCPTEGFIASEIIPGERAGADNSTNTTTLTEGTAIMMSGTVTLTSMDQPLPYAQGYMDYVAAFAAAGSALPRWASARVQTPPTSAQELITVTPNTYRIKLAARKGKEMYESAAQ